MAAADSKAVGPRRGPYALLAAAAVLPRLAVLLYQRGEVTAAYVDKGDDFARTFLASGSYGFIPDVPSAYTQPLYGFFLVPLYWIFDRSWVTVGLAQIAVAAATALVVYELGRRFVSARVGLVAALVATVHPYLVWHDVHMNREVLDQLLAAAAVLLALALAARPSLPLGAALGAVTGAAVLGNLRLVLLPLLLAGFVLACRRKATLVPALAVVAVAAVVISPWIVRNRASVGCLTLSTDARALWKANNRATLHVLQSGGWIDDVPPIPGAPPTPQDAGAIYRRTGRVVRTNECAQMRFYRRRALDFVRDHPGEKAKLAGVAARMLWQPSVTRTEGRRGAGTRLDTARTRVEPAYMIPLYALALFGLALVPRRLAALAVLLLAYTTLAAMLFAGETRYRVPWDFLVALAASAAALRLASRLAPARASSAGGGRPHHGRSAIRTTAKFGREVAERWSDQEYADPARYLGHRAELVQSLGPPLVPGDRVLDLACGDGGLALFLLPLGLSYLGVDASEAMVAATRERLGPRAEVALAHLDDFQPPAPVAATTIFRAIYYASDRAAFFRRVADFTEKKLVFDLNPRRYRLDEVRSELEAAGFGTLDLHPFFVPQHVALPGPLHRALLAAERGRFLPSALLRLRFSYVCAASR